MLGLNVWKALGGKLGATMFLPICSRTIGRSAQPSKAAFGQLQTFAMRKQRTTIARFEGTLMGMAGGVSLYRKGIDEFFLSHGLPRAMEELEAVRGQLEEIQMYGLCRTALIEAEVLVRQGPECDDRAVELLLQAGGELARASGSFDRLQRRFRAANDANSKN